MGTVQQDQLPEILSRVVRAVQPERVYLIGSYAYGAPTAHSDVDLLVVVPDSDQPISEQEKQAYLSLIGCRIPVDIIVMSATDMARRAHVVSSLSHLAQHKGKLIYAAEGH